jgi:hypothetical protein
MKKLFILLVLASAIAFAQAQVVRPLSNTVIQALTVDTLEAVHGVFTTLTQGGKTLTMAGNLTTAGAFPVTLTSSASTGVTLPTTGTLATLGGAETVTGVKKFTGHNLYFGEIITATDTLALAVATHYTVLADATSSAILLTLPDAATCAGAIIRVKCINADSAVKIVTAGGTIDGTVGATGFTLAVWDGREFQSNGVNWYITSKF